MTGGPGKEHENNKPPLTEEFRKYQKKTPCVLTPPRIIFTAILGWTMSVPPGRTLSQKAQPNNNLETNPITIKPEASSHLVDQFWVPLSYWSPSGYPFPIKLLAVLAQGFSQTIHFWVSGNSPLLGPGRGLSPFLEHRNLWLILYIHVCMCTHISV